MAWRVQVLEKWSQQSALAHPWTVADLLSSQAAAGRRVAMIIDLSNHDTLYADEIPASLAYVHIKLVAKVCPPSSSQLGVRAHCAGSQVFPPLVPLPVHAAPSGASQEAQGARPLNPEPAAREAAQRGEPGLTAACLTLTQGRSYRGPCRVPPPHRAATVTALMQGGPLHQAHPRHEPSRGAKGACFAF